MSKRNSPKKSRLLNSNGKSDLQVTVYNGGYSVVQESRGLKLSKGTNQVQLDGMPAQYRPASLLVVGVEGGEFVLGPVSYRAASLNAARLLQDSIGTQVTLRCSSKKGKTRQVSGKLLAF